VSASSEGKAQTLAGRLDKLYEFDREPIRAGNLHGGGRFAALFSGEHVAATEFVIGALFVQWGAGAKDLVWGLILGNLLAVLSWAFICAPIAVRVRLTLYWYARRIIGPGLTVIYNIVNAMLYCCLAAAMIGVSASAVILALNKIDYIPDIAHPTLQDVYPNSVGWVVVVCLVGAVVITLAIAGFKKLSQFSQVCAPWMFLVFIAGALASLPKLGEVHSFGEFWHIAQTQIWDGAAQPGTDKLGFWHIAFFAWFCNLAMHVGLSDMALFRYARKWTYGFYSAFGMYLGHFLAWVCAGIMGAAVGKGLNPGEMADAAAGTAGVLAVLIAGWTTANPTLYRAGLALQIVTPNWPRWKVTLAAGAITTIVGFFPAIFMKLLDFVAIYGLVLMPIGAVIVVEHWFFPVLGLRQYWADKKKLAFNPAALISWIAVLVICFPIEQFTGNAIRSPMALLGVHLFFRWLPGWFIAALLYIVLSAMMGARAAPGESASEPAGAQLAGGSGHPPAPPKRAGAPLGTKAWIAGSVALLALAFCLALSLQVLIGGIADPEMYQANMESYKGWFLIATIVYFVAAIVWTGEREKTKPKEVL